MLKPNLDELKVSFDFSNWPNEVVDKTLEEITAILIQALDDQNLRSLRELREALFHCFWVALLKEFRKRTEARDENHRSGD